MLQTVIPQGYAPCLNLYDTQKAIGLLKRLFEDTLGGALHLRRVSAPLFVEASTGLNDDLNGVERAVSFDIPDAGRDAQVVHSLAKWKRLALYRYQFSVGEGLYTDMNAIRRDEELDKFNLFLGKTAETYKNWNKGGKAPWSDFWDAKSQNVLVLLSNTYDEELYNSFFAAINERI